ncbi:hypothetical protein [Aestuariibius sp. HNIBRBA575]|uniref:hypothetical protein n=1 Tax=Aestuariibius sp. HNIBRBA575 TaxID=3233343 RepID=UPI0034A25801
MSQVPEKNDFIGPKQPVQRPHADNITRLEDKIDQLIKSLPDQASKTMIPTETRAHRLVTWMETSWGTRLAAVAGIWLILATLVGFWSEYTIRAEERAARAEEAEFRKLAQIATAWDVLLRPIGGDIGKGNARNTLILAGQSFSQTDFSCAAIGLYRNGVCVQPPVFSDVANIDERQFHQRISELNRLDFNSVSLDAINFENSILNNLRISGFTLTPNLRGVSGFEWRVNDARVGLHSYREPHFAFQTSFQDPFEGFECEFCEFYNSKLTLDFALKLRGSTLVNTIIEVPTAYEGRIETGENLGPPGGFSGRTIVFLHRPSVFVWSFLEITPVLKPADLLVEASHEYLLYCANGTDFELVKAHWQKIRTSLIEPDTINALSSALRDIHHAQTPVTQRWNGPAFDQHETPYHCGLSYQTVAPVLRPRLFDVIERAYDFPVDARVQSSEQVE